MYRIKPVKDIFHILALYKAAFAIVHIDGQECKTCFPFIIEPAASNNSLGSFFISEPVHDEEKNKTSPSIVSLQKNRDSQQCQYTDKLHFLVVPEVFQCTECQISQKKSEKYILFLIPPGIGKHKVPWDLRDACKQKQIQSVFLTVMCMQKSLNQKKTEDRERCSSDIAEYPVPTVIHTAETEQCCSCRGIIIQDHDTGMVDEHQDDRN